MRRSGRKWALVGAALFGLSLSPAFAQDEVQALEKSKAKAGTEQHQDCALCTAKANLRAQVLCDSCKDAGKGQLCAQCKQLGGALASVRCMPCDLREQAMAKCTDCKAAGEPCAACRTRMKTELASVSPVCATCTASFKQNATEKCDCFEQDRLCAQCVQAAQKAARGPCADCIVQTAMAQHGCLDCAVKNAVLAGTSCCADCYKDSSNCKECSTLQAPVRAVACATCAARKSGSG